ncbi:hypothetical protein [Elizabethkingia anophelis]|uniref:hypothetical protein n=1 Tax=Elizabethkingia anophelis TaxID=1117645 RepID=UPI00301CB043
MKKQKWPEQKDINKIPKYKLGTTIAIDRLKVLSYFDIYIAHKNEGTEKETYTCKDGSILILQPGNIDTKVFVKFHLNLLDPIENALSFPGKNWFIQFCRENNSEIQNLRTGVIMPVSNAYIMSDIFTSEAFRISRHYATHPKDKPK